MENIWAVKEADATAGLVDVKLFRTGEMYLIRAEANAETNKLNEANSDLNVLRKARIQDYQNQVIASKDELIDAILAERYKELAFEGHRFFDLKRRKMPIRRGPQDAVNTAEHYCWSQQKHNTIFLFLQMKYLSTKIWCKNPGYTNNKMKIHAMIAMIIGSAAVVASCNHNDGKGEARHDERTICSGNSWWCRDNFEKNMTDSMEQAYKTVLEQALQAGYSQLKQGSSSLDAVEQAIHVMEDSPLV